jgi:drug/metabolite transporter (DMT)-like permease
MKLRSFFQLHISVFLFGFTAILGDIIRLPLLSLVWWRVAMTIAILFLIIGPLRLLRASNRMLWKRHGLIGLLIGVHWLAFYGSIKLSNASIVLIAVSTSSFITALIEPLIIRSSKWKAFDIIISVLVIPAMLLIYYNASEVQQTGLWVGLFASLVGAVFSILNKRWIVKDQELEITFIQQLTVTVSLTILMILLTFTSTQNIWQIPETTDWFYLFIFAAICTVLAYVLYLKAMNWLSAFDVSFAFNMEPVYGLVMAALILRDYQDLSIKIYLGMAFILLMVLIHTLLKSGKLRLKV